MEWVHLTVLMCILGSSCCANDDIKDRRYSGSLLKRQRLLRTVINSVYKSLQFFDEQHRELNLDALVGLRMVGGQLYSLIKNKEPNVDLDVGVDIMQSLREMRDYATSIADSSLYYVKQDTPHYYCAMGILIKNQTFWDQIYSSFSYPTKDVRMDLVWKTSKKGESVRETQSDSCITHLIGTNKHCKKQPKCVISEKCWKMMTSKGSVGYSLSHQPLYLISGVMASCNDKLEEMSTKYYRTSINHMISEICANMYQNALKISDNGFQYRDRDLFSEIGLICDIFGFRQFFREDWLTEALSWQRKNGCYGDKQKWEKVVNDAYRTGHYFKKRSLHQIHIQKRVEKPLDGGCLAHYTTVSMGYMGGYIRSIIETILEV